MLTAFFEFFFFQAEDGIRDVAVTGVQTCALPIFRVAATAAALHRELEARARVGESGVRRLCLIEHDFERRILTDLEPEVTAGAELDVDPDRVARGRGVGENAGLVLLLSPALLADGPEVRGQRERERLRRVEQPRDLRLGRVRRLLANRLRLEDRAGVGCGAGCREGDERSPTPPAVLHPV